MYLLLMNNFIFILVNIFDFVLLISKFAEF